MRFSAFRLFVSVWKSWNDDKFFAELFEAEDERWNFVCARIFFFLSPFSPPLSLIFWSTRHRYHPFAKGFSMKEYQHYHGDTLISEVPHSWRNTSIKVSEPRLWNLLVYYKMLWALAHQPSFQRCNQLDSVFDPEKYFHRMIHILRAHWLCQIFFPTFRIFYPGVYSWRKKKEKRRGAFRNATLNSFRWIFGEISFGRNIPFGNEVDELEVWLRIIKHIFWKEKKTRGENFTNGRVYFTKRINQIYISHIL